MATIIELIEQKTGDSVINWRKNIPSKVFFKRTTNPKVWYHLHKINGILGIKGSYASIATYETCKKQIFNNIPIKDIELNLVASRAQMGLTMEEIQQFINTLRTISNRKEE